MNNVPYDLTRDRRRMERRLQPRSMPSDLYRQGALLIERRHTDRRRDSRPLNEFPWLPHTCC